MEDDDYRGPCTVLCGEEELSAEVVLRGYFQPIDGRFHWYGRLVRQPEISEFARGGKHEVVLTTPEGQAVGVLSDPDPWDRYRIAGVGRPPFAIDTDLDQVS